LRSSLEADDMPLRDQTAMSRWIESTGVLGNVPVLRFWFRDLFEVHSSHDSAGVSKNSWRGMPFPPTTRSRASGYRARNGSSPGVLPLLPLFTSIAQSFVLVRLRSQIATSKFPPHRPQYPPPFFAPACSVLTAIIRSPAPTAELFPAPPIRFSVFPRPSNNRRGDTVRFCGSSWK